MRPYVKLLCPLIIITLRVSRRRREMYCGHAHLCVCLCVCLSGAACPRYCTHPDVTWGSGGGFAIVARVALHGQHNVNHSYELAFVSDIAYITDECKLVTTVRVMYSRRICAEK